MSGSTKISVSIVLHKTNPSLINNLIECCCKSLSRLNIYLIDNSPDDKLKYLMNDNRVNYYKSDKNGGYGAGHNLAIRKFELLKRYDYHIAINPDIEFSEEVIGSIVAYMNLNINVGVLMPKIVNNDGTLQYARRLLPSPLDIFIKRFVPSSRYSSKYEMRNLEAKAPVEIVGLCGCFMFLRTSALENIGLFDENYFMYFEDIDLSRRISMQYRSIYFPNTRVIHFSNNEHRRNLKLFFYAIRSTIKYFNKWSYTDSDRKKINLNTISKIKKINNEITLGD